MKDNFYRTSRNSAFTLRHWLQHHVDSAGKSLRRLLANPFSFSITTLMIAIAFTIPAAIYVLFNSINNLADLWSNDGQITLFLKTDASLEQAGALQNQLSSRSDISTTYIIDKSTALQEFRQQSSLGSIVDSLPNNPLPHMLVAKPHEDISSLKALQSLQTSLAQLEAVDHVQFDMIWVLRARAIIELAFRMLWIVTIVLLAAVGLIIANVIRWEVASRHDEIEIIRLVGGTDSYVRRPFLYSGFWLGFTGAGIAVLVITLSGLIIGNSLAKLANLSASEIELGMLSPLQFTAILFTGGLFGAGGAWLAVSQRLRSLS